MTKKQIIITFISLMVITIIYKTYSGYKDSCLGGNGKDCMVKSDRFAKQQFLPEAETYSLKACQLKEYEGCLRYARIANIKHDIALSREYYFQACKLNKEGCYASIEFEISQNNLKDALTMAGLSCNEENDQVACHYLGIIKIKEGDHVKGIELLKRSCEKQVAQSCYYLAGYYFDYKDLDACAYFLNEGCKLGHEMSCTKSTRRLDNLPAGSFSDRF